ncbi:MAG TPA: hypothetical protein VF613_17570 [Longimicrobium sp.]|jgi:hypothetical protein
MSEITADSLASRAREAALEAVWAQWSVLNPMLLRDASAKVPSSVIDPEALVLASLGLWEAERRLVDVLAWWAVRGATLLSTRRIGTLRTGFPGDTTQRLGRFGFWAHQGGDTRWKPRGVAHVPVRAGKGPSGLRLNGPATLLLRLRAGFGVSAKSDVLAFLLALDGEPAAPREIARAPGYADKNVRVAARDLTMGGFIEERDSYPIGYASRPGFARGLVRLLSQDNSPEAVPNWCHWAAVYAFLLSVMSWDEEEGLSNPYVLSSWARDLFEEYRWLFRSAELRVPEPKH